MQTMLFGTEVGKVSIDKLGRNGRRAGLDRGGEDDEGVQQPPCQWLAQLHANPHAECGDVF